MIGERLNELRKDHHLSQEKLGEILSLTKYTISSYEMNKSTPNDEIKVRIARYFDVSLDYLLGLIDEPLSYRRSQNVLRLPKDITLKEKKDIQNYVDFIRNSKKR